MKKTSGKIAKVWRRQRKSSSRHPLILKPVISARGGEQRHSVAKKMSKLPLCKPIWDLYPSKRTSTLSLLSFLKLIKSVLTLKKDFFLLIYDCINGAKYLMTGFLERYIGLLVDIWAHQRIWQHRLMIDVCFEACNNSQAWMERVTGGPGPPFALKSRLCAEKHKKWFKLTEYPKIIWLWKEHCINFLIFVFFVELFLLDCWYSNFKVQLISSKFYIDMNKNPVYKNIYISKD